MEWKSLPYNAPDYNEETDTVIRQSTISQLQMCEYREKLKGQEGFLEPVDERMVFGTCTHYLIENDLRVGEPRLDLLANMNEWVEEILVSDYNWSLSKVPQAGLFFSEITAAYRLWRLEVYPNLPGKAISIEEEMYTYLAQGQSGNLWLRGTPDAVYENVIMDWKTSGKAWNPNKAHLSIQASLYMALVKQNMNLAIRDWVFWVYDRRKSTWDAIPTQRRVKDVDSALHTAEAMARKLEAGVFTASPVPEGGFPKKRGWYCGANYCPAWNICPAKFLADEVSETQVAIRSWN